MQIRNKTEYYRLWRAGCLGNRPRTWATVDDLIASGYGGLVTVRSTMVGWRTRYDVGLTEAVKLACKTPGATFNESLPDHKLLIQGEVMQGVGGLDLTFSIVQKPMKLALAQRTEWAHGLLAKLTLEHFLSPASMDDLYALWDLYPGAVIEFSCYEVNLGDQPYRNTIIWEVRHY